MKKSPDTGYQAILYVSFGGPNGTEDVVPFLENVTRGRNVPPERLREVARHYDRFGGKSPINEQNRKIMRALKAELAATGIRLPVYFGNRNWHPLLTEALSQMADDGIERALAFVTSGFSCYSGCRQYREDIERAIGEVRERAPALTVDKLRVFYNHPDFIAANTESLADAVQQMPPGRPFHVVFTAHSIPVSMAEHSSYEQQLEDAARSVAGEAGIDDFAIAYQSRTGSPHVPWLEPDILDHLEVRAKHGVTDVIVHPLGFVSDHLEVLFDLDVEARQRAELLGISMVRARTPGTSPLFISMIRRLIQERIGDGVEPLAIGRYGPNPHICVPDCCRSG